MYDVITIGAGVRDVFIVSKAFKILPSKEFPTGYGECVSFGSKIEVDHLVLTTGGGGTNAAATFAQLGFNTATVTQIGDDATGKAVLDDLKQLGVKRTLVNTIKGGDTGYSTLLTATNGERSVLVHRGVSGEFTDKSIPWSKLKAKWIYISSLGGNVALALKIMKHAKKLGIDVAYNPGSSELKKGYRALTPIIRDLSILNVNKEEAQMLARTNSDDIRVLCEKLSHPGMTVIITDGPRGAYAYQDGRLVYARTRNIKGISRTGAGDAFGSGTVAALMKGYAIDDALRVGTINAESVIQSYGAKQGILSSWPSDALMKKIRTREI